MRSCIVFTRVHQIYEDVRVCNGGVTKSEVFCSCLLKVSLCTVMVSSKYLRRFEKIVLSH